MLVIVRGTIEDGHVHEEEAESLRVWLKHHPDVTVTGMGREVAEKVVGIFADRVVTADELRELRDMLARAVGQELL